MLIAARTGVLKETKVKPAESKVKYLYCGSIGPYIDSGISCLNNDTPIQFQSKIRFDSSQYLNTGTPFGVESNLSSNYQMSWLRFSSDNYWIQYFNKCSFKITNSSKYINVPLTCNAEISNDNWILTMNEDTYTTAVASSKTILPTGSWHVFKRNNMSSSSQTLNDYFYGRIYYLKLFDAERGLLRDFIPYRVGSVGYLYDNVSKQLFANAGSGSFKLGPDIEE